MGVTSARKDSGPSKTLTHVIRQQAEDSWSNFGLECPEDEIEKNLWKVLRVSGRKVTSLIQMSTHWNQRGYEVGKRRLGDVEIKPKEESLKEGSCISSRRLDTMQWCARHAQSSR